MSEIEPGRRAQELSPHNILAHSALTLPPHDASIEDAASATSEKPALSQDCDQAISPEMSSPVCDGAGLHPSQREANIGFGKTKGSKDMRLDNGRISAWNAAVFIMGQMDRLGQTWAPPAVGPPIVGHCPKEDTDSTRTRHVDKHHKYCVDVSPDTFEMLAFIMTIVSEDRRFDGSDGGSEFRVYVLVAAIRLLKVNLVGLLRDTISACVKSRMALDTTVNFHLDDTNQFQLDGDISQDSLMESILRESSSHRASMSTSASQTPSNTLSDQPNQGGQDLMGGDTRRVGTKAPVMERYRDVLYALRRRLLLLVHSSPCSDRVTGGEVVQQEAAAALILGVELFFSSQADQFRLITELMMNTGIDNDEEQESFIDGDSDDIDRLLCGPRAVRHYMLNPLLQRLCDDALASKLVPYGTDPENESTVCTLVESLPPAPVPALQDHHAIGASARLLEIHVRVKKEKYLQNSVPLSAVSKHY